MTYQPYNPTGVRDDAKYVARGMMTRPQVKKAVRERDGHACARCGMTADEHRALHQTDLHVHRLVPGSLYTVDGCITVCFACHSQEARRKAGDPEREYVKRPPKPDPPPRPVRPPKQPKADQPRKAFHAPPELFAALEQYVRRTKPPPTEAAALRTALEEFLTRKGLWPPPDNPA